MGLQLSELFLQDLQPLLLVSNVHHGGCVFLRLQQLLELGQLGLLLLVGNVQPLLNVELVALVLRDIGQRGVVETDNLVDSPGMVKCVFRSVQSISYRDCFLQIFSSLQADSAICSEKPFITCSSLYSNI